MENGEIHASLLVANDNFKRIEHALELAADNIGKLMAIAQLQVTTAGFHEQRLQRLEGGAPTGPVEHAGTR